MFIGRFFLNSIFLRFISAFGLFVYLDDLKTLVSFVPVKDKRLQPSRMYVTDVLKMTNNKQSDKNLLLLFLFFNYVA